MVTKTNAAIAQLRAVSLDSTASPQHRMRAASKLLKLGASERSVPVIRSVSKAFESHADSVIAVRAQRLATRLERAIEEVREAVESKRASLATSANPIIGGIAVLPPDFEDPVYWDRDGNGNTLRMQFCTVWALPADANRAEIISAIESDQQRLNANVSKVQVWACSRTQLDERYAKDLATLTTMLTGQNVEYSEAALDQLAAAAPRPFIQFKRSENGKDFPTIGLTDSGELIDKIRTIKTWPQKRASHNQL